MADPRPVASNDYAEIARFLAEFPGGEQPMEFWLRRLRLWWDDNPAFAPDVPRGWILRDGAAGSVVGFLGNVPSMFRVAGEDRRVFNATTWRVRPDQRGSSLQLYLAQVEAANGELMFNTTPNDAVVKVLSYLRFTSLPSYPSGRVYLVPLRPSLAARAWLRGRTVPNVPRALASIFERATPPLAGIGLRFASLPLDLRLRVGGSRFVHRVTRAGPEFDALWERTKDAYRYASVRSAARLRWLCEGPFERSLLGYTRDGDLRGYALFGDATWRGLRVLEMLDLWTDRDQNEHVTRALIAGAHADARARGYDLIALHDYSAALGATYRALGIHFTASDARRHFFGSGDTAPPPMTRDDAYFSALEGDLAV